MKKPFRHLVHVLSSLSIATLIPAGVAVADDVNAGLTSKEWLEKMGSALREEQYEGTFIYMRGSQFNTVKVAHEFKDGNEIESMTNLTGELRQIVRNGDEAICYHANSEHTELSHPMPMGPFTRSFSETLAANPGTYKVSLHGVGRIAGRTAQRVSVLPHNRDRYGYRLWLDQESGLLLRSDLLNQGRVLEVFQFTDIAIGETIDPTEFVASVGDGAITHELTEAPQTTDDSPQNWRVAWVPSGFQPVRTPRRNGMTFTDGVATLSIFVENQGDSLGDLQTSIGGTVVLSRKLAGSKNQITVVGEVPLDTAKRVADSVEPVIY